MPMLSSVYNNNCIILTAAQALQEMNGKVLETGTLAVRYADPEARRIFYLPAPPAASSVHDPGDTTTPEPVSGVFVCQGKC